MPNSIANLPVFILAVAELKMPQLVSRTFPHILANGALRDRLHISVTKAVASGAIDADIASMSAPKPRYNSDDYVSTNAILTPYICKDVLVGQGLSGVAGNVH